MPDEFLDFLLIRDLYHCVPSALEQEDNAKLTMHREFKRIMVVQEEIARKRAEQKAKLKSK